MASTRLKLALAQLAPAFLDKPATIQRACDAVAEAGSNGASAILFPEAFVPGYPDWAWALAPGEGDLQQKLYGLFVENSVDVPGSDLDPLKSAAAEAGLEVFIGASERNSESSGTSLYNSLIHIASSGELGGVHRKLVPTVAERLVWTGGDGSTLNAFETPFGNISGLICWENYMPLARQVMYSTGALLHLAPTWDRGESWQTAVRHIAREGRMFVASCCMPLRLQHIPEPLGLRERYPAGTDWINVGGSMVAGPEGDVIVGPVLEKEQIIYAEIDLGSVAGSRWMFDSAGHYNRPDVFRLEVDRTPRSSGESHG